MNVNEYLSNWAACYKKDLTENILPFWLKTVLTVSMVVYTLASTVTEV